MMNNKIVFSSKNVSNYNENRFNSIIEKGAKLTRIALNRYFSNSRFAPNTYSTKVTDNEYNEINKTVYDCILKYCAEKSGIDSIDFNTKEGLAFAWNNPMFSYWMFAIQAKIYQEVNSDNEIEDAMTFANVVQVGLGDSFTVEPESLALFKVQEKAYSNNVTRLQKHYRTGITITPSPKIGGVSFDLNQLTGSGYDFGKFMAKLAMSFRVKMYQDVVDVVYTVANVSSTVFYSASFAKTTYITLAERLRGAANAGVTAYGTNIAFAAISDTVTTSFGYMTQDDVIRSGSIVGDIYGIPRVNVDQAVNSNTASFTLRVPNDRILLLAARGDKPVKLVKENYFYVSIDDGKDAPLQERIYKYNDSWEAQYATQCPYAIQVI